MSVKNAAKTSMKEKPSSSLINGGIKIYDLGGGEKSTLNTTKLSTIGYDVPVEDEDKPLEVGMEGTRTQLNIPDETHNLFDK